MAGPARRWRPQRRSASTRTTIGILALAVIAIIAAVAWNMHSISVGENCPRVVDCTLDANVNGHAPSVTRVQPGEHIDSGKAGTIRLEWLDHSMVDLGHQARAEVVADQVRHLRLERGDLGALLTVATPAPGLVIDLPAGRLEAFSGEFTISLDQGVAQVHLAQGRLRLLPTIGPAQDLVGLADGVLGTSHR